MARPNKTGLDYFSHDTDLAQDKKVRLLKAKHGLIGYAVYVRLLEELYNDKGYYLKADDEFNLLFADDNNVEINIYKNILNDCIYFGLFDADLFDKYEILTSKRVQKSYCVATGKRKCNDFISEYLLVDVVNEYNNKDKVSINSINGGNKKQIEIERETEREIESKQKEKVKEKKHKHGEYNNVLLTDAEVERLKNDLGDDYEYMLSEFSAGIKMKDYKYKDHNLAIRKWYKRELDGRAIKPQSRIEKTMASLKRFVEEGEDE